MPGAVSHYNRVHVSILRQGSHIGVSKQLNGSHVGANLPVGVELSVSYLNTFVSSDKFA